VIRIVLSQAISIAVVIPGSHFFEEPVLIVETELQNIAITTNLKCNLLNAVAEDQINTSLAERPRMS
jgi:hypothetical protein